MNRWPFCRSAVDLSVFAGGETVFLLNGPEKGGIVAEAGAFCHHAQVGAPEHELPGAVQPLLGHIAVEAHAQPPAAQMGQGALADMELLNIGFSDNEQVVCISENDACGVDAVQVMLGCSIGKGNLLFLARMSRVSSRLALLYMAASQPMSRRSDS